MMTKGMGPNPMANDLQGREFTEEVGFETTDMTNVVIAILDKVAKPLFIP